MIKHEFDTPQGKITSLVMDRKEFDELMDLINKSGLIEDYGVLAQLRQVGHLPLVARGTKTEFIFDKYEIETEAFSAIIRGAAENVQNLLRGTEARNPRSVEWAKETFDEDIEILFDNLIKQEEMVDPRTLPPEIKKSIEGKSVEIVETMVNGGDPTEVVSEFIRKHSIGHPEATRDRQIKESLASLAKGMFIGLKVLEQEEFGKFIMQMTCNTLAVAYKEFQKGMTN
jgi:hypothetical protein